MCISEEKPANQECEGCEADLLGEGKESGEINTAQSLVFTALQVMLLECFLVVQAALHTEMPQMLKRLCSILSV